MLKTKVYYMGRMNQEVLKLGIEVRAKGMSKISSSKQGHRCKVTFRITLLLNPYLSVRTPTAF